MIFWWHFVLFGLKVQLFLCCDNWFCMFYLSHLMKVACYEQHRSKRHLADQICFIQKSMCQGEENKIIKIIFHCIICPFQWSDHMLKSNSATEASFKEHFPKYWSELIQKSLKVYIKISCWWINDGDLAPIATRQGDRLSNMNWSLKDASDQIL